MSATQQCFEYLSDKKYLKITIKKKKKLKKLSQAFCTQYARSIWVRRQIQNARIRIRFIVKRLLGILCKSENNFSPNSIFIKLCTNILNVILDYILINAKTRFNVCVLHALFFKYYSPPLPVNILSSHVYTRIHV